LYHAKKIITGRERRERAISPSPGEDQLLRKTMGEDQLLRKNADSCNQLCFLSLSNPLYQLI
jgi:hypothetical protein